MIRVRNLVKTFDSFTAVNDVSFDVAEGEIFAFLGPNGAGKTTTIKMLTTLLKPTSGAIELDGLDPLRHSRTRRASASASSSRTPASTANLPPGRTWRSTAFCTTCRTRCAVSGRRNCSSCSNLGAAQGPGEEVLRRHEAAA